MPTAPANTLPGVPPEPLYLSVIQETSLDCREAVEFGPIPTRHLAERVEALRCANTTVDILTELEVIVNGYNTSSQRSRRPLRSRLLAGSSSGRNPDRAPTWLGPLPTRTVQSAARSALVTLYETQALIQGTEKL